MFIVKLSVAAMLVHKNDHFDVTVDNRTYFDIAFLLGYSLCKTLKLAHICETSCSVGCLRRAY